MDALDVRNLYEAYRSVYEDQQSLNEDVDYVDEGYKELPVDSMLKQASRHGEAVGRSGGDQESSLKRAQRVGRMMSAARKHSSEKSQAKASENFRRGESRQNQNNEDLDIYDLVLDHLLDEGFCDDVESAEVVMANMSEEWLDEILGLSEETKGETHMLKGAKGMSGEDRANVLHQVRKAKRSEKEEKTVRQRVLGHKLSNQRDRNERSR
jgi:hypothetical protein